MNSDENVMPKQFKSTLQRKHTINHPKPHKQEPKNTKKKKWKQLAGMKITISINHKPKTLQNSM